MTILLAFIMAISIAFLQIFASSSITSADGLPTNQALPDLSGIAWIDNDTFLAIHDAKFPEEATAPRASLLSLPSELGGTVITPLNVTWPQGEDPGSDLECIARLPDAFQTQDTPRFLIGESGDNDRGSKRILLSELNNDSLLVTNTVPWPGDIYNVEGCAVTTIDNELIFVFAERAQGSQNTSINWATLLLDPLRFGPVNSVEYRAASGQQAGIDPGFRPVSALEIDDDGNILIASAIDPDVDTGPFASEVWLAGHTSSQQDSTGSPISMLDSPQRLASVDGLKIEGLATRPTGNGSGTELIIGTDDEFSGGVLRVLRQTVSGNTTSLISQ
ncbi:MAG: hypothetical protein WBX01_07690 [Nitrososphaeraceae archaeon]